MILPRRTDSWVPDIFSDHRTAIICGGSSPLLDIFFFTAALFQDMQYMLAYELFYLDWQCITHDNRVSFLFRI